MRLAIVHGYPPNYLELDAAFGITQIPGVLITYGHTVYVPDGQRVWPEILDHETVHAERQTADIRAIEAWWSKYVSDPEFRFDEELLGHIAEYRGAMKRHGPGKKTALVLERAAARLASALYGGIATPERARRAILEGRA